MTPHAPTPQQKPPGTPPAARPGMLREVVTLEAGPVTVTFPAPLSSASDRDLAGHFAIFLRKARRRRSATEAAMQAIQDALNLTKDDEAASQGGLADRSEGAHRFGFRNHAITERLCVGHAATCESDDAFCDDFPVMSLTVDVERGTGPLQSFGHCRDGVRFEYSVVVEELTNRHGLAPV